MVIFKKRKQRPPDKTHIADQPDILAAFRHKPQEVRILPAPDTADGLHHGKLWILEHVEPNQFVIPTTCLDAIHLNRNSRAAFGVLRNGDSIDNDEALRS